MKQSSNAALKPSDLIDEEFDESSERSHVAQDLRTFRYYNERVHKIKCDS